MSDLAPISVPFSTQPEFAMEALLRSLATGLLSPNVTRRVRRIEGRDGEPERWQINIDIFQPHVGPVDWHFTV